MQFQDTNRSIAYCLQPQLAINSKLELTFVLWLASAFPFSRSCTLLRSSFLQANIRAVSPAFMDSIYALVTAIETLIEDYKLQTWSCRLTFGFASMRTPIMGEWLR